jgi:hypothetical protein
VGGGSGIAFGGIGTAGSSGSTVFAFASSGSCSEPGKRYHPLWIPARRRIPISLRWEPPILHHPHQYRSRNRQGARPKPVTQKSEFKICESYSTHFLRGELISSQVGVHMAGAALQRSKNSMPPHATTFRLYRVMRKPDGVRNHFQNPFRPMTKERFQGSLGGGMYPFAYLIECQWAFLC